MASLVKGGNVQGTAPGVTPLANANTKTASQQLLNNLLSSTYAGAARYTPPAKPKPTRSSWVMLALTVLTLTGFVLCTVFAGLGAHPQNVYVEVTTHPATTYQGYFKDLNPWPGALLFNLLTAIICGIAFIVLLSTTIARHGKKFGPLGEWLEDWDALVIYITVLVTMGIFIGIFMPLSTTGSFVDTNMMNERADNWITDNLHIPTVMNYAENAESNTKYAEYNVDHKLIHFTVQSSLSTIKVIPQK